MRKFSDFVNETKIKELKELDGKNKLSDSPVKYIDFDYKKSIANFECGDYKLEIQLESKPKNTLTEKEIYSLILKDDVKVSCTCRDFLYSGAKHNNWKLGTGIYKEERPPVKRDANLDNYFCKHLNSLYAHINK